MAPTQCPLILFVPLIGSDDRTGRGGPSPWEQDTAGNDSFPNMWRGSRPSPDGGGEEVDTPVTPDNREEIVLCGTDIVRQTNGQVRTEVKEGPVEKKTGFCTKTCSGREIEGSPIVNDGEVLGELCVIAEEAEDAVLALAPGTSGQLQVMQMSSISLEQTACENVDFQASLGIPRAYFENILEGATIKKTSTEPSESSML